LSFEMYTSKASLIQPGILLPIEMILIFNEAN